MHHALLLALYLIVVVLAAIFGGFGVAAFAIGLLGLWLASSWVHRAYQAALPTPGRVLSALERTRAYAANEEFLGDHLGEHIPD